MIVTRYTPKAQRPCVVSTCAIPALIARLGEGSNRGDFTSAVFVSHQDTGLEYSVTLTREELERGLAFIDRANKGS